MTLCLRCDWAPDLTTDTTPRDQLRQHALDWAHPLCTLCSRSLDSAHPQTCETCIQRTQETLSGIITMWTELPRELGHARAQAYDRDGRGGNGEPPLPGGTVLALLAPGAAGGAARKLTPTDVERGEEGREHAADNQPDDAPSVAWTLASWEDDWRHTRGEPAAVVPGGTSAVVRAAAGYLERHTRWAANQHDAFDEYASDLRGLHARLEVALGRVRRPVKAGAECFVCSGPLVRGVTEAGFEEDHVTCRECGETYGPARYSLALKAAAQAASRFSDGDEEWATPAALAGDGLREATIRSWRQRDQIRGTVRAGVLFVSVADVEARQAERVA